MTDQIPLPVVPPPPPVPAPAPKPQPKPDDTLPETLPDPGAGADQPSK